MEKNSKEISKEEISNWLLMNVYIIVIPPFAKMIVTFIIGYKVDIQAIFTDYSLVVFAIIFNLVSLIYEKTQKLLLRESEKVELGVYNKWLLLCATVCGSIYLFSVTYKILSGFILSLIVTGIVVYCIRVAKNILFIVEKYSQENSSVSPMTNGQTTEENAVNKPLEECQKE